MGKDSCEVEEVVGGMVGHCRCWGDARDERVAYAATVIGSHHRTTIFATSSRLSAFL